MMTESLFGDLIPSVVDLLRAVEGVRGDRLGRWGSLVDRSGGMEGHRWGRRGIPKREDLTPFLLYQ